MQIKATTIAEVVGRNRGNRREDCDVGVFLMRVSNGVGAVTTMAWNGRTLGHATTGKTHRNGTSEIRTRQVRPKSRRECSKNGDQGSMQMRVTDEQAIDGWWHVCPI